ncbi:MAG: hypothetical protein KDJ36_11460, partial [Hyphomicrobiaceae bacterium]|nr:hypothetical protein [Hyphomicrobiaceae bacterium]
MDQTAPLSPTAGHLLTALGRANHVTEPFSYWLLENILPESVVDGIAALPFAPPAAPEFDGRR